MKKILLFIFLIGYANFYFGQTKYSKDFSEFWNDVNDNYAYLNEQQINWQKVKEIYEPKIAFVKNDSEFISFLETVLNESYNGHSSLNTNLYSSNRLIPSGQDLYVENIGGQFIISDIKPNSKAENSGLKIGMKILQFNGQSVEPQLLKFLPKYTQNHNLKMKQFALDMLFVGTHNVKREIVVEENGGQKKYFLDENPVKTNPSLLENKIIDKNTAYIKINNSLGNNDLISEFDKTLDSLLHYKNLILDITNTPGGGNTTVARAIMGRFISKELPYQKHEFDEKQFGTKRIWVEYASPRKTQYKGKLTVLVGHWTGSMGEGIAIGFDGMKRGKIVGTKMAGLLGAVSNFGLSETKIGYQFPTERLYHINGTPRENFLPKIITQNSQETYNKTKIIQNK